MRILLIEDDRKPARLLTRGLQEEGFVVDVAYSGEEGHEKATVNDYDVVMLDWLLPGKKGIAVCRDLRTRGVAAPILMLTARDALGDRVAGLNAGLGLAICRVLVEGQGGGISVASTPGGGATVSIRLPLAS